VQIGMAVKKKYHLTISPAGRLHKSAHTTVSRVSLHSMRSEQCSVMVLFARTFCTHMVGGNQKKRKEYSTKWAFTRTTQCHFLKNEDVIEGLLIY
jgi:hypothetical protein